jgi:site-specific DNA-methyltransferase (adenine-specific)
MALIPDDCIDCIVTSIPFEMMRHYSDDSEDLGNYQGRDFIEKLVPVIQECRRLLKPTGNLFLNFQPQTVGGALSPTSWLLPQALAANGLYIVQALAVLKTNAMPSNDPKRLKPSVEHVYHCVKDLAEYLVFKDAIRRPALWAQRDNRPWKYSAKGADPGSVIFPALERIRRMSEREVLTNLLGEDGNVLTIAKTQNQSIVHPAKMADEVAQWLITYGSPVGGVVADNFCGSGTTLIQAKALGRHYLGGDLNHVYVAQAEAALAQVQFGQLLDPTAPEPIRTRPAPRQDAPGASSKPLLTCRHCGASFEPHKGWQAFCSDVCRFKHHNANRRKHDQETDARRDRPTSTPKPQDGLRLDQSAQNSTPQGRRQAPL